jgi:1,4-dihydroxy-2-naphthoate octaprenyltransferase
VHYAALVSGLTRVRVFLRLGRPLFLVGGFVLFALGAAVAAFAGATIDWRLYALGQLTVTSFQAMTHYANDYFDYDADRANATATRWSGGSRVLANGELPRSVALITALALALLGTAVAATLAVHAKTGPWTAALFLLTLTLSWSYSAPPLQLHSRGVGELNVAVVVTFLVPLAGFYLQSPDLRGLRLLLLAVVPLCALQFAMVLGVAFPDAAADASVGKRTLVVRCGGARAAWLYALAVSSAYLALPWLAWGGLPAPVTAAVAVGAPVAAWRCFCVVGSADWRSPERFESLAFWAVALLVGTSLLELAALLWLIARPG